VTSVYICLRHVRASELTVNVIIFCQVGVLCFYRIDNRNSANLYSNRCLLCILAETCVVLRSLRGFLSALTKWIESTDRPRSVSYSCVVTDCRFY
jgi:hypothetical protein